MGITVPYISCIVILKRILLTFHQYRIKLTYAIVIVQVELSKLHGYNSWDYSCQLWDEFSLGNIVTSSVKITVITVYTTLNNGFTEVEYYIGTSEYGLCYESILRSQHNSYHRDIY